MIDGSSMLAASGTPEKPRFSRNDKMCPALPEIDTNRHRMFSKPGVGFAMHTAQQADGWLAWGRASRLWCDHRQFYRPGIAVGACSCTEPGLQLIAGLRHGTLDYLCSPGLAYVHT